MGIKISHEEKLGVKAGGERNVTTAQDGTRNGAYNLTTGFSKSTKDEETRVTDAGIFTEKRTDRWVGFGVWYHGSREEHGTPSKHVASKE